MLATVRETSVVEGCLPPTSNYIGDSFGQAYPVRTIRRWAAQLGDAIVVMGFTVPRAGLELLLYPELGQNLSDAERTA